MFLKLTDMSSKEYSKEMEAMSETPGNFAMKAIKIVMEVVKKVMRRVSIKMIVTSKSIEMGSKNWNMLKQLTITDNKTEKITTVDKVS